MSQLIKATITPFKAIHFKQNASLVSSQNIEMARRQAIARQHAFKVQNAVHNTNANSDYMTQVRRAFAGHSAASVSSQVSSAASSASQIQSAAQTQADMQIQVSTQAAAAQPVSPEAVSVDVQDYSQAVYTQERGSFELRVAKGDVSYIPALDMTVITQYPDVQFEYLGGFQYVPPSSAPTGENINLSL